VTAGIPADETERLEALHRYRVLDTPPEPAFDRITALVARLFEAPIALVSLVDRDRQWFKSALGLTARETKRAVAFCAHAILGDGVMVVADTCADARFAQNPLVTAAPGLRFYAGAPLRSPDGHNIGALSVIDTVPRGLLAESQRRTLVDLAATVVDELELRLAALRAEEAEERFRVLFESSPDAILILDPHDPAVSWPIVDCNAAACRMNGYARDDLISRSIDILHEQPAEPAQRAAYLDELRRSGQFQVEAVHRRKDGTDFPVDVSTSLIRLSGREFVLGVDRDATRRKKDQQEREALIRELAGKNGELERLVYTVSHDLRSPLFTIQGFLAVMQKDVSQGQWQSLPDHLGRVCNAAEKMGRLIVELLEISRIGKVVNPAEDVPFGDLVREALSLVEGRLTAGGVRVEPLGGEAVIVRGDRGRLVEVLQNLLDNAARFAGANEPPLVAIGVRESSGAPVFFVRDNGPGIEPRYHDRIFRLFETLDPSSGGSGVGLAIVQRIVELHGGRVWVESEGQGKGATFCFTLAGARTPAAAPPV
jgi:PAS domain S-box-containing protein